MTFLRTALGAALLASTVGIGAAGAQPAADTLRVRQGAVRVRAHRAYKALAEILGAPFMMPQPA